MVKLMEPSSSIDGNLDVTAITGDITDSGDLIVAGDIEPAAAVVDRDRGALGLAPVSGPAAADVETWADRAADAAARAASK